MWRPDGRLPGVPGLIVLLSLALVLVMGGLAGAHSALVSAAPGNGARVEGGPGTVRAVFNEPLQAGASRLEVVDAHGKVVAQGESSGAPEMTAQTGDLPAGEYTVRWTIVSADGHALRGSWQFIVDTVAKDATAPKDATTPSKAAAGSDATTTPAPSGPPAPATRTPAGSMPAGSMPAAKGAWVGWAMGALVVLVLAGLLVRRGALAARHRQDG